MDVSSNLPFLFVGAWGLLVVIGPKSDASFLTNSERWPYVAIVTQQVSPGKRAMELYKCSSIIFHKLRQPTLGVDEVGGYFVSRMDLATPPYALWRSGMDGNDSLKQVEI
jgi:hypothetical protein